MIKGRGIKAEKIDFRGLSFRLSELLMEQNLKKFSWSMQCNVNIHKTKTQQSHIPRSHVDNVFFRANWRVFWVARR